MDGHLLCGLGLASGRAADELVLWGVRQAWKWQQGAVLDLEQFGWNEKGQMMIRYRQVGDEGWFLGECGEREDGLRLTTVFWYNVFAMVSMVVGSAHWMLWNDGGSMAGVEKVDRLYSCVKNAEIARFARSVLDGYIRDKCEEHLGGV